MKFTSSVALGLLSLASNAFAETADDSLCGKYTTALLKENTPANQYLLLTLLVNTVVIGNYTQPNVGIAVPGILAPGKYDGEDVNLLPYFNGDLVSANDHGTPRAVNFLDDGGAEPLKLNKPANTKTSAQYKLMTHLYQFFGLLLGCKVGEGDFPSYGGSTSMFAVHRYMNLSPAEIGYFITQVGLAAASFGVSEADAKAVGEALNKAFGYRCSPPATIVPKTEPALQAICIAETCPLAPMSTCAAYPNDGASVEPEVSIKSSNGTNGTTSNGSHTGALPTAVAGANGNSVWGVGVLAAAGLAAAALL